MSKYESLPPDTDWRAMFRTGDVKPSPNDPRDFPALARNETPVTLPASFRLPERPIRNQGGKGACVSFSFARILERHLAGSDLSEDEMYARCRTPYDWICQDTGSFPRDCAAISVSEGWLTEAQRPYDDRDLCTPPDANRASLGAANRATEYRLARNWEDVKQLLYQHNTGATICLTVFDSFFNVGADGIMPPPSGRPAGGHCMVIEGWDEHHAWVANSWSSGWGQRGYLRIPLRYVDGSVPPEQGGIWTGDLWTVLVARPDPEPEPMPEEGYSEGYAEARTQDLDFLRWLADFYEDQETDFGEIAEIICRYAIDVIEGYVPPAAMPKRRTPPTAKG